MIPKALAIAVGVGAAAGAAFGLVFADFGGANQLVFVDGASLSIVTERTDFKRGEEIKIRIVNSGTVPLTFPDTSYGISVIQLDGIELYSPDSLPSPTSLEPGDEATLVWDQVKNDGDAALHGTYKITATAAAGNRDEIKKSVPINIFR